MSSKTITIFSPRSEDIHGAPIGQLPIKMTENRAVATRDSLRRLPARDRAQENLLGALDEALRDHDRAVAAHGLDLALEGGGETK